MSAMGEDERSEGRGEVRFQEHLRHVRYSGLVFCLVILAFMKITRKDKRALKYPLSRLEF